MAKRSELLSLSRERVRENAARIAFLQSNFPQPPGTPAQQTRIQQEFSFAMPALLLFSAVAYLIGKALEAAK